MIIQISYKDTKEKTPTLIIKKFFNVVQFDLNNMSFDESESDWNFISIIQKENDILKKTVIKLDEIWQLSILEK